MSKAAAGRKYGLSPAGVRGYLSDRDERLDVKYGLDRKKLKPCGTVAAYRRHRRQNEEACFRCKEANALYTMMIRYKDKSDESIE